MTRALALTIIVGLAGCFLEPDVGPTLAGSCSNADTDPDTSVSFRGQIRPLIVRAQAMGGCTCHLPTAAGPTAAMLLSGLDLSSLDSLRSGGVNSRAQIIVAMEPCASVIFQKVAGAPPFGSRMPLGGPPFLSDDELALLHDWIAEGAADN